MKITDEETWKNFKETSKLLKSFTLCKEVGDGGQGKVFLVIS